ncbi:MAG: MATE family efflux transporter [Clostridia bacterium]|nr:MATE family efflux transporter [Clostridia bacterium]
MKNIFSVKSLLPPSGAVGDIPSTRDVYSRVLSIAMPSVCEMVLMSLISSIDTMMVGTIGPEAIAAVGIVGQPRMLVLSIFFALNIGVTAIVARRKGEGRQADANTTLRNAIMIVAACSIVMMILSVTFSRQLMTLAGAKADTIDDADAYFRILNLFLPVNTLTLCICAAQRGVGNTRITMYVNVTSNLVNVLFNYLLIGGNWGFPRLEVRGAAYATVMGLSVGFVLSIITIVGHGRRGYAGFLHLSARDNWKPDIQSIKAVTTLGGNAMLEQVALRFGFFAYARIVAELGTMAFAAHQICMQFLNLSFTCADGIGIAGTSLVGQMMGAKRPDLEVIYAKAAQRIALVAALLIAGTVAIFRVPLVGLFTQDHLVAGLACQVMIVVAVFQPFQTASVVISGALRGAGDNRYVAKVMLLCVAIIRPVCAMAAVYLLGTVLNLGDMALIGAWSASLIDMVIRMTLMYRRFNSGKWQEIVI